MASGNAIRGSRVGAGPMGEAERGEAAPRFRLSYLTVFGLNGLIMYVVADLAGVAYLIPLAAVITVTPVVTFLLNRYWVFA